MVHLIALLRFIVGRWRNPVPNALAIKAEMPRIPDHKAGNQRRELPANLPSY
jgi:hypothetical protein